MMDEGWLEQKYVEEYMTCAEIGALVGVRGEEIRSQLIQFGIPRRQKGKRAGIPHPHTEEWNKKIALSNMNYKELEDVEWLRERYEDDGLSCQQIADMVGCKTSNSVWKALKMHRIPRRAQGLTLEATKKGIEASANVRRGKPSPRRGTTHSEETKEKQRQARLLWMEQHPGWAEEHSAKMSGPNNANWKGGFGALPYPLEFSYRLKRNIRKRDGHTCQNCGKSARSVHHIDYDKENNDALNLITLCQLCNNRANWNRESWEFYYMALQVERIFTERR